jgi:hypothetical protein
MQLFTRVGRQISGRQRSLIAELAGTTGLYRRAELDCGGLRWPRRLRGIDVLTLLGGGEPPPRRSFGTGPPTSGRRRRSGPSSTPAHASCPPCSTSSTTPTRPSASPRPTPCSAWDRPWSRPSPGGWPGRRRRRRRRPRPRPRDPPRRRDAPPGGGGIRDPVFIPPALRLSRAEDPPVRARAVALLGLVGGEAAVARAQEMLARRRPPGPDGSRPRPRQPGLLAGCPGRGRAASRSELGRAAGSGAGAPGHGRARAAGASPRHGR